jgi:hypothetical protein
LWPTSTAVGLKGNRFNFPPVAFEIVKKARKDEIQTQLEGHLPYRLRSYLR